MFGKKKTIKTKLKGFTLIELLLTTSLMGITGVIAVPFYQSFMLRNDLDIAANTIVFTARRAQSLAQSGEGDKRWGILIQIGKVTVFKGDSYASRDITIDEDVSFPPRVIPSGKVEFVFEKLTSYPLSSGSTTISAQNIESRTLSMNSKGIISY